MGSLAASVSPTANSIVFTTDGEAPSRRLDAWNGAFGSLNAISPLSEMPDVPGTRTENWLLGGGLVLSQTQVSAARFTRDRQRARGDSLDHLTLRVMRRGQGRLRHVGFDAITRPGDLVLFSMHETWSVEWDGADWVTLCIPRDLDLRLSAGLSALRPGLLRGAGAGLLADMMLALPGRAAAASVDEVPTLAGAIHAAIGACLLAGSGLGEAAADPLADASLGLARERVRRAILRNIGSARLTPAQLAAAAGLSRSALYRLYEAEGGVARYVQHVRLSLAHAALRDPQMAHQSIAVIAELHGFPAPSDFSRAFRAAFGVAPSDVRAMGLSAPAMPALPLARPPVRPRRDFAALIYAGLGSD